MSADRDAAIAPSPLPRILEIKRTLAGTEKHFECALLSRTESDIDGAIEGGRRTHIVVLFIAPTAMHVHGIDLPPGTVTFGHFWTDRPYNVYHWLDPRDGSTIGYYFNVASDTTVSGNRLEWRDLSVDILGIPGRPFQILDEDEIPADVSTTLRQEILRAAAGIVAHESTHIRDLELHRAALWPRVAPLLRARAVQS